jgi:hypothetical protein
VLLLVVIAGMVSNRLLVPYYEQHKAQQVISICTYIRFRELPELCLDDLR